MEQGEDTNVAMGPSETPSWNGDRLIDESNDETSSSEQNIKASRKRQDPEKISLEGLGPEPNVERLAQRDGNEEVVYPTGLKLFLLASVCPLNHIHGQISLQESLIVYTDLRSASQSSLSLSTAQSSQRPCPASRINSIASMT